MKWSFWTRPFDSYVFLWIALGLLCLTVMVAGAALASRQRDEWVAHTLEVLQHLERCESGLLAAEVRVRENTIWIDEKSRQAAETGIAEAYQSIENLMRLSTDNIHQHIRIKILQSLTNQIAENLRAQIQAATLVRRPMPPPLETPSGLQLTDAINEIRHEEQALLKERQSEQASAYNSFWILAAAVLTLNLLLVWWAFQASRRYVTERNRTEKEIRDLNNRLAEQMIQIRQLNSSLEERVHEKTKELESAVVKLQNTNQELERFTYVTSHDLQEPLRQIASFSNLLSLKYGNQLDDAGRRYLEYSVAGAKRLQSMLRGLLQYTLIHPSAVHVSEFPIEAMIHSVVDELQQEIHQADATIVVRGAEGMLVHGDSTMIRTVVLALVSNAIKFRDKSAPPRVQITCEQRADDWTITVTDNGIGVEERFLPQVFEMFARLHPVDEYQGAGVGLAVSKKIAEAHGGILGVRSGLDGKGSVFSMTIPSALKAEKLLEMSRLP
jgi:signal transduction histidine kinase